MLKKEPMSVERALVSGAAAKRGRPKGEERDGFAALPSEVEDASGRRCPVDLVNFYGALLPTFCDSNGRIHVLMRPVVEAIGLDWEAQRKRIQREDMTRFSTVILTVVIPGHGTTKATVLPLWVAPVWLAGLSIKMVAEPLRESLLRWKLEMFAAIERHHIERTTAAPPEPLPGSIFESERGRRFAEERARLGFATIKAMADEVGVKAALLGRIERLGIVPASALLHLIGAGVDVRYWVWGVEPITIHERRLIAGLRKADPQRQQALALELLPQPPAD